jgi:hypothetical protein
MCEMPTRISIVSPALATKSVAKPTLPPACLASWDRLLPLQVR